MDEVKLNFVALLDQDKKIKAYRKFVLDSQQEKDDDDYRTKFLINEDTEVQLFDVSLSPKDGYDAFECNYSINPHYTEYYLFHELKNTLLSEEIEISYNAQKKSMYKEIRFIFEHFTKGDTEIIVHPYFLYSRGQAGFIFQHHFKMSIQDTITFDREIQKLSLSLDASGKQNIFYYRDKEEKIRTFISIFFYKFAKGKSFEINNTFSSISTYKLKEKSYIVKDRQPVPSQFLGIKKHGPFKEINGEPRYLFIFSEKTRTLARDIYLGLTGKLFPAQFSGLKSMFNLDINNSLVDYHLVEKFNRKSIDSIEEKSKE